MNNGLRTRAAALLAAALLLPGTAVAQERQDPCPTPTPSPSPDPTETPTPTPPSPLPTESPSPEPTPSPTEPECPEEPSPSPTPSPDDDKDKSKDKSGKPKAPKDQNGEEDELEEPGYLALQSAYNTDVLMLVAAQLRALGWSADEIVPNVYAPFIVGGEASWIDTWGAPRFGPGPIVRTHEGQDVFCDYGDPVLASEEGVVDYDDAGLGGIVARLHRPSGGYWYYAHLSATNEAEFSAGSTVQPGDVIGFCGNSGNAITTPPHVHFGLYKANGEAKNPMRPLIRWLKEARANSLDVLAQAEGTRVGDIDSLTAARMFGDAVAPGLSEVGVNVHSVALAEERAALHLVQELLTEGDIAGDAAESDNTRRAGKKFARKESAD